MRSWAVALCLGTVGIMPLPAQRLDLPPRPADAPGGHAFLASLRDLDLDTREARITDEVLRGNVPQWERRLVPVTTTRLVNGDSVRVTFWAAPDYLVVGSDSDWVQLPLSPQAAQRIADSLGMSLPTPVMVDGIWRVAVGRLGPDSIAPSPAMTTVPVFEEHNRMVQRKRAASHAPLGALVAGNQKDVVVTARLDSLPDRVAIYGWHLPDGQPIQPLYTGHGNRWVDYSHGIRLVSRRILIDGREHDLLDVLRDPVLSQAVSDEGPMRLARYPTTR